MGKNTFSNRSKERKFSNQTGFHVGLQKSRKPLILAVETSGRIGSVAIALGGQLLAESTFSAPMKHSAQIFPAACTLLNRFGRKPAEIEQVYISVGPGSFTGLRIATALAKIMHLTTTAKIVAVDTLDVIAANVINLTEVNIVRDSSHEPRATSYERIAAVLDAKRGQFFIAVYQRNTSHGTWKKTLPDSLMTASQFLEAFVAKAPPIWLLGEGLVYYKDKFEADGIRFLDKCCWSPKAAKVHSLGWQMALKGQFADPLTLQPTYLRRPEIGTRRI